MTRTVKPARAVSKKQPRQLAGKSPSTGGSIHPAMQVFKALFPQKTALELALRTGADLSHCERCLAGTRELGAGFQQKLLQSDVGREILIALMGDAKPASADKAQDDELAALRKQMAEMQAKLDKLGK